MQLALRPYVTAGIALAGASVIAVTPIAPHPDLHLPAVNLTAAIDNPIQVFTPVVDAAGAWITNTIQSEIANPFPILHQIATNQFATAQQLLQAINAGGAALGDLAAGLPAALQAAGAKLATGDVNGAIDAIISSGLNPIISLITGVWTPLQQVLQRPFAVGQALVPALFDSALSLALAAVASTVGIGFDTGTAPLIQQIITSTQSVLTAVTTLNPINVLNAIQHGFADVTLNLIKQLDSFTTGTLPFIRDTIVAALKVTPATAPLAAAVAQAPEATASELAAPAADTGTATPATEIESPAASTPVDVVEVVDEGTPVDTVTAEPVTVDATIVDVPETATVVTPVASTEEPAAETTATKGSTTVTRDSLKAEPGKTGLASGTEGGSETQTESNESTVTKPASEAEKPSSTPSDNAGTSAGADSGSGTDSDSGGDSA